MIRFRIAACLVALTGLASLAGGGQKPLLTVKDLSTSFDPRKEELDGRVVREWEKGGIVYRYITYHIGSFKGRPARMAGYYGFPRGAKSLPGLLHLHGGGQRAFLHEVEFYATKGYACLSINWGGRDMENREKGEPNTEWGAVDPTQGNVPGYFNLKPGELCLDPYESPRNNNWYLLALGARRALTFLERQPEVDPERLGVYGHSMGGDLTVYVAGTDRRVKAAAPSAGGSGYRTQPWPLLPQERKITPNGDVKLFDATIGLESYARHIEAPLLWLGATNDFHGVMDDTYRTGALIPHADVRYAFAPHLNHRFTPDIAVTRPLWFDQYLKGGPALPATPRSTLVLATGDHVPELRVTLDPSRRVEDVRVYYSVDPDPRARFWRSAVTTMSGGVWRAKLPLLSVDRPLFAFANAAYRLTKTESEPFALPAERFSLSSLLHTAAPKELQRAGVRPTDRSERQIDDPARDWRDWYRLSADNQHHWEYSTRKLADPKWRGEPGWRLKIDVRAEEANELVVLLTENFFRSYRGKQSEFAAVVKLRGGEQQTVSLAPEDFTGIDGVALAGWQSVDLLTLRAYCDMGGRLLGSKNWAGRQPSFRNLRWETPENDGDAGLRPAGGEGKAQRSSGDPSPHSAHRLGSRPR